MERGTFVFYKDWMEAIKDLPDDIRLEIYESIIGYATTGNLQGLKPMAKVAFNFIKADIDRDAKKYMSTKTRNQENGKRGGRPRKEPQNNPENPVGYLETQTNPKNLDNDNVYDNDQKKRSTNVDGKESSLFESEDAEDPPVVVSSWRQDYATYLQELNEAYTTLINDTCFMNERQKYHPKLDIILSMEKALKDYWATETGWKKKKAGRVKELDWKKTFVNALTMDSNKVYRTSGQTAYVPVTENQKKFTAYLQKHAPLMLEMPIQPTDEEIENLRKYPNGILVSVVAEINNNRYLTKGRNSVYQTILEVMEKSER